MRGRLVNKVLDAYRGDGPYVFVSYSHADKLVLRELGWLQDHGIDLWYDEGIHPGSRWTDHLAQQIKDSKLVLYFVTPNSAGSENCRNEIDKTTHVDCLFYRCTAQIHRKFLTRPAKARSSNRQTSRHQVRWRESALIVLSAAAKRPRRCQWSRCWSRSTPLRHHQCRQWQYLCSLVPHQGSPGALLQSSPPAPGRE
jgi:hypothetical protein